MGRTGQLSGARLLDFGNARQHGVQRSDRGVLTFSVESRHPVEVGANEEAHLVQWLSKRVGRKLFAPDLSALGFRLMGGRLFPADTKAAGWFMYEDGKGTRLSCYFLSADIGAETEFKYREQNGVARSIGSMTGWPTRLPAMPTANC